MVKKYHWILAKNANETAKKKFRFIKLIPNTDENITKNNIVDKIQEKFKDSINKHDDILIKIIDYTFHSGYLLKTKLDDDYFLYFFEYYKPKEVTKMLVIDFKVKERKILSQIDLINDKNIKNDVKEQKIDIVVQET